MDADAVVSRLHVQAYTIPTDFPEADGTASWSSTTIIVVHAKGSGRPGLGYTHSHESIVPLIREKLAKAVSGVDVMDPPAAWRAMQIAVRNLGREGLAATAISSVDVALWDLKATLLGVSLASLLGSYRRSVPIYGSGGFTSYDDRQLTRQLAGWVHEQGCGCVKMKIGSQPERDPARVAAAKRAIGAAALFVDANGAYGRKQALDLAERFAREQDVRWFEEPVTSDDLERLQELRRRAPPTMDIAAGEYGYTLGYFRRMLEAGAVDVLQADATRCGGVTGFLQAVVLCEAHQTDLSAHCAPALHRHLGCAAPRLRNLEWFHDHVRIEHMLLAGAPDPRNGAVAPDFSRPGLGPELKSKDAEAFVVAGGTAG
jgi:L-alanine-DL-glutamate epimerase-like enolase superfamily enzyme